MKIIKKFLSLALCVILVLSAVPTVHAENEAAVEPYARQMLQYYLNYQDNARTDIARLVQEMGTIDAAQAEAWESIMSYWSQAHSDTFLNNNVLPDGLPEDNSLCIVVLGYALQSDGGMQNELVQRLKVALASAEKYPNAYILCTGGGSNKTEAEQMARWLKKQGISEDRIIIEKKAKSTIENAKYGCAMLYKDYPQVTTLAVVTSDYHIYRSCLYFNTQSALDAYKLDTKPMKVVAAATCVINPKAPTDVDTQVEGMCILTGLEAFNLTRPNLSRLDSIQLSAPAECPLGEEPELLVSATYSNGYTREVTKDVSFSGIDFGKAGTQTVTATYEEGGRVRTATVEIRFIPGEEPATEAPTEAPTPTETVPEIVIEGPELSELLVPGIIAVICLLLLVILLILKKHQAKKRRRPKPVIKLD